MQPGRPDARGSGGERAGKIAESLVRDHAERERIGLARSLGISTKRLLGWEAQERHEHFDADGTPTGWTVVTRESEWDDHERNRMLALSIWESGLSPCGHHSTLTGDKTNLFAIEEDHCGVCASMAQYLRIQASRDEAAMQKHGEDPRPEVKWPSDGRRTYVRQMSPLEVAARQAEPPGTTSLRSSRASRAPNRRP